MWTETQDGRFACYSSIVDNFTGDPVYIEGEGYGSFLPEEFIEIIPVVASKKGAYGTNWKTEVIITNVGLEEQEIKIIYHQSSFSISVFHNEIIANPPLTKGERKGYFKIPLNLPLKKGEIFQTLNLTLAPGEVWYFKDILTEFFSFPESFGWLEIRHSTSGLKVRARIYTEQQSSRAEEQKKNLFSVPSIQSQKRFKLSLIKDGKVIDEKEIGVQEGSLIQINNILSTIFNKTGSGYVLRITPEEDVVYTSYISKVENKTGDAIFQKCF